MENKPTQSKPPKFLYQYRPPEVWALENLSQRVMYFTPPAKFNDPYDCNIAPRLAYLTGAKFAAFRRAFPRLPHRKDAHPFDGLSKAEAIDKFNGNMVKMQKAFRNFYGVACFSARNDILPMWSHYAGRGMGFCLAFAAREISGACFLERDEVERVEYISKIPVAESMKEWKAQGRLSKLLLYKSKEWKYEREWRIVRTGPGKKEYDGELLKAVYFGTKATKGTVKAVRAIVKDEYKDVNVKFYKGRPSKTEYKVVFRQIR